MAHSNSTTNYSLPQFVSADKPAWLTDVNTAYSDIDTGMHNAQVTANAAQSDATQALTTAGEAATSASAADAKASGAIASIASTFDTTATYSVGDHVIYNNLLYSCTVAIVNPGPWSGSANWERITIDNIALGLAGEIDTIDNKTGTDIPLSDSDSRTVSSRILANTAAITNLETTHHDFIGAGSTIKLACETIVTYLASNTSITALYGCIQGGFGVAVYTASQSNGINRRILLCEGAILLTASQDGSGSISYKTATLTPA